MGMGMTLIPMGINYHRRMQCLAYVIVRYLFWHLLFIMTILLLMTIMLQFMETARFSDKLSTMIFYVSRVLDTPKMFMPQRLNDCLGIGMGRNRNWPYGNGRNGNVKSHSRSSLTHSIVLCNTCVHWHLICVFSVFLICLRSCIFPNVQREWYCIT